MRLATGGSPPDSGAPPTPGHPHTARETE
jgi:hypothetical protein